MTLAIKWSLRSCVGKEFHAGGPATTRSSMLVVLQRQNFKNHKAAFTPRQHVSREHVACCRQRVARPRNIALV